MATNLFSTGTTFFEPDIKNVNEALSAYTELILDDNKPVSFCMIHQSGGKQNARLQIQASVGGAFFITGCSDGIGTYDMLFMDGIKNESCSDGSNKAISNDSILSKYISLKDLKARRAVVKIYAPSGVVTSNPCGQFVGIINGMSTRLTEEQDGNLLLYVGLSMVGGWGEA